MGINNRVGLEVTVKGLKIIAVEFRETKYDRLAK